LATPGTASSRGFKVQSTNVRSAIGLIFSETRPTFSKSIVEETSGESFGGFTPVGSWVAISPSRSPNICRAICTSVPSLKTTVITERP